jgi:hypothetical protein
MLSVKAIGYAKARSVIPDLRPDRLRLTLDP